MERNKRMEATEQEKEIKRIQETWGGGGELMRTPQHCQLLFVKFSSSSSSIKWSSTAQTTIRTGCSETLCTLVTSLLTIVFRTMDGSSGMTRNWILMNTNTAER
jgi:hypothetical protein